MKKIMLQGYLQVPNFGDVLYGHLFYQKCKELGFEEIDFFQYKNLGIGAHCREEYGYHTIKNPLQCLRADAYVIISGGSLWDNGQSKANAKTRFLRFILPARLYQLMGKPIYVLGVGGGPVDTPWLRKQIVKMLNKAEVIQFRDRFTRDVYAGYHVKTDMQVTADTALVIDRDMLEPLREKEELDRCAEGRKKLLVHIPDGAYENEMLAAKVMPAVVRFLREHSDYIAVISHDNIRNLDAREREAIHNTERQLMEEKIDVFHYGYHDSWQLCSLIQEMDCVITAKLHVGVLGCALGKAVVSFPVHREKTQNFYAMIGESARCLHMNEVTLDKAYEQICTFYDKPVIISEEMRRKARMNLEVLEEIRRRV